MNTIRETAETIASRYDYISKMQFMLAVKEIEGTLHGRDGIRIVLDIWNKYYAD